MQSAITSIEKKSWRRLMIAAVVFGLTSILAIAQTALAQTTPPLKFGNNYFVTGDYVVAGVGLRGLGNSSGFATGTITMPDATTVSSDPSGGVPAGAQVVAAFLFWQTVESTVTQPPINPAQGFFGVKDGPSYAITGTLLPSPSGPVAWSSGGCSGGSHGSKTINTYRADVRAYLPVDSNGNVEPGNMQNKVKYVVSLVDSGSNGGGVPFTLGASLVIIYRVMDPSDPLPLNSVVIYDGSFAPSNSSSDMIQKIEGYYQQATSGPITKLTPIVGNGQSNKNEYVSLNGVGLSSLYENLPPFPGYYNGSWDNPTWRFPNGNDPGAGLLPNPTATLEVTPSFSNSGCVSWAAVILSTTVQDSDKDGLLDKWETQGGYCDASINNGSCNPGDPSWVSLPDEPDPVMQSDDSNPGQDDPSPDKKDIYVQMDYMCRDPEAPTCDPTDTASFLPSQSVLDSLVSVFASKGIDLHLIPRYAIPQDTCDDTKIYPKLCQYPMQPGVVAWKGGFVFLKNELVTPDGTPCSTEGVGSCEPRFQHGRKDSYHYALFGNALGAPNWTWDKFGGTLTGVYVSASQGTVTFYTKTDPQYDPVTNPTGVIAENTVNEGNDRVTVSGVVSDPNLNGTFHVTDAGASGNGFYFEIKDNNLSTTSPAPTWSTDPSLAIASGEAGTISGASDVGGEDTAVTLGSWGADGESPTVQAGIFMHELGHTLGLTHGGTYYAGSSYVPTYGPNCKPNYQSVMNYLFTVDLLGTSQTLDYSEQKLQTLDEGTLSSVTSLPGTVDSTSRWYTLTNPSGVGTAASYYCDGTPVPPGDPKMYRILGPTDPISPAWENYQDINFDGNDQDINPNGNDNESLRGYDDWTNLNLQQMGAAGNLSTASGPGAAANFGPGAAANFGPGAAANFGPGAAANFGPGAAANFGPGNGEINLAQANSVTRPPRNLKAEMQTSSKGNKVYVKLSWEKPTFGQIDVYNIYRGVDAAPDTSSPYASVTGNPPPADTTYSDTKISCGHTYNYFVTAAIKVDNQLQESQPSNTVTVSKCTVLQ